MGVHIGMRDWFINNLPMSLIMPFSLLVVSVGIVVLTVLLILGVIVGV